MTSDLGRASTSGLRSGVRIVGTATLVMSLVLLVVLALTLRACLGTSIPSRSTLPDLPSGLRIDDVRDGCGSGGCYLEFDVTGDGLGADEILGRLPREESCRANGLLDRRPRCTGYDRFPDGSVRGYVSIREWLK